MLLNWRLWAAAILATALAASHWKAYHSGKTHGKSEVQAEWDADTLQALKDDKKNTKERLEKNAKVDHKFQIEKAKLQAKSDSANAALNGLRDTLNSAKTDNPTAACRVDAGGTERELLGQCAATLVRLAKEADRVESKLTGLQDYVNQVVKP